LASVHDYTSQESVRLGDSGKLFWHDILSVFFSQWETRPLSCGGGVKFPRMQLVREREHYTSQVWWWQAGMTSPTTAMRHHRSINNIFVDIRNKSDQKACNS